MLERLGEWDNTVVVFFSDNGGLPSHGSVNHPFRGGKGDYWEGGVHVPAFFSGGFVSSALARNNVEPYRYGHLTHVTDVHATMLGLAGFSGGDGVALDGVNLWEALVETKAPTREAVVINVNSPNFAKSAAVRWGKYKLIRNPEPLETAIYSRVQAKLVSEGLVVSEVRRDPVVCGHCLSPRSACACICLFGGWLLFFQAACDVLTVSVGCANGSGMVASTFYARPPTLCAGSILVSKAFAILGMYGLLRGKRSACPATRAWLLCVHYRTLCVFKSVALGVFCGDRVTGSFLLERSDGGSP